MTESRVCSGPMSRRSLLKAGCLGWGGLSLADLLRGRAAANNSPPQTSVILVWLVGGQSHLETYDMKPNAPREIRGDFSPISTNVPGVDICELLPRHAKLADKFTLIRSLEHAFPGHVDGAQMVLSGHPPKGVNPLTEIPDFPDLGCVYKAVTPPRANGLPQNIAMRHDLYYVGPAYLGAANGACVVPTRTANKPDFYVPSLDVPIHQVGRLDSRNELRKSFDRIHRNVDAGGVMQAMDQFDTEALRMLTGNRAQKAFDLSAVDPRTRDRYGRSLFGQGLLLARRLVEAGVGFVSVDGGWFQDVHPMLADNWDDHETNKHIFQAMHHRLPPYDQAVTALIEDLHQTGLDQNVLLVVMGEFGRTPQIFYSNGTPGRGHHPGANTALVSGGGFQMGQVIGETDSRGERPRNRTLHPTDLLATIYRFLGVNYQQELRNFNGRPIPILPRGEPIRELLASSRSL